MSVVDGGHDQVLQHPHVVFRHHLGVDRHGEQVLVPVDGDRHHPAAGGRLHAQLAHLLLEPLLRLLRLLHHCLKIHDAPDPLTR